MDKTPANTVRVDVLKVKDKPFYVVVGPGGSVVAANPMYDGLTGEKEMTSEEIYREYEKILMMDEHIKNPDHYEVSNSYLAPDNLDMFAKLDMRSRTLEEMAQAIRESTVG